MAEQKIPRQPSNSMIWGQLCMSRFVSCVRPNVSINSGAGLLTRWASSETTCCSSSGRVRWSSSRRSSRWSKARRRAQRRVRRAVRKRLRERLRERLRGRPFRLRPAAGSLLWTPAPWTAASTPCAPSWWAQREVKGESLQGRAGELERGERRREEKSFLTSASIWYLPATHAPIAPHCRCMFLYVTCGVTNCDSHFAAPEQAEQHARVVAQSACTEIGSLGLKLYAEIGSRFL